MSVHTISAANTSTGTCSIKSQPLLTKNTNISSSCNSQDKLDQVKTDSIPVIKGLVVKPQAEAMLLNDGSWVDTSNSPPPHLQNDQELVEVHTLQCNNPPKCSTDPPSTDFEVIELDSPTPFPPGPLSSAPLYPALVSHDSNSLLNQLIACDFEEQVECDVNEVTSPSMNHESEMIIDTSSVTRIPNINRIPSNQLKNFKALNRRSMLQRESRDDLADTLQFYADTRFTPMPVENGVYQVLTSGPGFKGNKFDWSYTMVYHGFMTHSWSLLPAGKVVRNCGPILRPISILSTNGSDMRKYEARITDLADLDSACNIKLTHYHDSYNLYGTHLGFKLDNDFQYEWKPHSNGKGKKDEELFLWRSNLIDGTTSVAARMFPNSFIKDPTTGSDLWCLEVDVDKISPHIALMSGFYIKETHATAHSFFAPKSVEVPNPLPLLNFAFQDEGTVYQNTELYWGENLHPNVDEDKKTSHITKIVLIRVFNKAFLEKFNLHKGVITLLEDEADNEIAILKAKYNIFI